VSKSFRTCDLDQPFLLPPSLQDWLQENHLVRFIAGLMPGLDLFKIYGHYGRRDGRGKAAYHPVMMVRLLLYGYCVGVRSPRRMEHASYDDIAFRYLCADQHPDHDTIADFRQQHLPVLAQIFTQVLQLCDKAGLVKLGHVAIDGTKLQANAGKHKAMSLDYRCSVERGRKFRNHLVATLGVVVGLLTVYLTRACFGAHDATGVFTLCTTFTHPQGRG
jgi:transposase